MYHPQPSGVSSKATYRSIPTQAREEKKKKEKRKKNKRSNIFAVPERKVSSIGSIGSDSCCELGLPLIAVRQQLLLVVQQLLPGLSGILSIGGLDNGVDRTRFCIMSVIP